MSASEIANKSIINTFRLKVECKAVAEQANGKRRSTTAWPSKTCCGHDEGEGQQRTTILLLHLPLLWRSLLNSSPHFTRWFTANERLTNCFCLMVSAVCLRSWFSLVALYNKFDPQIKIFKIQQKSHKFLMKIIVVEKWWTYVRQKRYITL